MMTQAPRRLANHVAVVTGGSSGIGRAVCQAIAREGAAVAVVGTDRGRIDETVASLAEPANRSASHLPLALDVRSEDDMRRMADLVVERFARIDILVACAGILRPPGGMPKPLVKVSVGEWDQILDTNLKGVFLSNRAVLPAMIAQRRGTIINLSSVSGLRGRAHDAPYCASKFGIIGLTQSLAEEVRGHSIRVELVLPDAVATPIWRQNGPVPMPAHALAPERVADLVRFMLTEPEDTVLVAPVIAPFASAQRSAAGRG